MGFKGAIIINIRVSLISLAAHGSHKHGGKRCTQRLIPSWLGRDFSG